MSYDFNLIERPYIDLLDDFSLEATLPKRSEIVEVREHVNHGTRVYLSAPPKLSPFELADLAREVRLANLEPVPHIVARAYPNRGSLDDFLSRISGEAGVRRVLALAGDRTEAAGPFPDALAIIESDLLQKHGITDVGISAYPDGHPNIADNILTAALNDKVAAAKLRGLMVHIITQFCFDPECIVAWLRRLRLSGIDLPVRLGISGPTRMRTLTQYAARCGVRASLKGMLNSNARQLLGSKITPSFLIQSVRKRLVHLNLQADVKLHFFAFGGFVETARWAGTPTINTMLKE